MVRLMCCSHYFFLLNSNQECVAFSFQNLKTPSNLLVVNLALSDLIMLTTNFPFFTYNCFNGQWMFSATYCTIYAAFGEFITLFH